MTPYPETTYTGHCQPDPSVPCRTLVLPPERFEWNEYGLSIYLDYTRKRARRRKQELAYALATAHLPCWTRES